MGKRLDRAFYSRDVLEVAPQLLGQRLVKPGPDGKTSIYVITETEAYRGGEVPTTTEARNSPRNS